MTKEELRKILDESIKEVCTPELLEKVKTNLAGPGKIPPDDDVKFSIRVNRVVDREILLQVLSRILADK